MRITCAFALIGKSIPIFSFSFFSPAMQSQTATDLCFFPQSHARRERKSKTYFANRPFALRGHVTLFYMKMKVIRFCLQKTISVSYLKQNYSDLVFQTRTIFLRWLDIVFQGQYLPSLSVNCVAINKDSEKLTPQLYQIKMKIGYDQGCNDIGVVIATK